MKRPNEIIRDERIKMIFAESILWKENEIEIFKLNSFQYRFVQNGHIVDYYPTSGKYHDITIQERGYCPTNKIITLFNRKIK